MSLIAPALAVDHTRSVGEPYALAGKRMVFTNWYYIRPGQIDWKDASGKSVYGDDKIAAGPNDAHFENYLAPRGIRLVAQKAQRGEPIVRREKPWETMAISGNTLIREGDKYRLWASSQKSATEKFGCYFESTDGKTWTRPDLGLVEYEGSKQNNLYKAPGGYIFSDPTAPESERFKW